MFSIAAWSQVFKKISGVLSTSRRDGVGRPAMLLICVGAARAQTVSVRTESHETSLFCADAAARANITAIRLQARC